MERLGPTTVLEQTFDGTFSELWWSMSTGDGKYLGIRVTRNGRTEKILTVVGDHFVYARNRARDLPKAESLTALVAAQHATRAQIVEYLDCELSYARSAAAGSRGRSATRRCPGAKARASTSPRTS